MASEVSGWPSAGANVGAGTMSSSGSGIIERILRWFKPPKLAPRLSSESVLSIARSRAASEGYEADKLQMVTHREIDGRIVWHVSEAAIGAVLLIEVDDQDGDVRFIGRLPGR
jgi:hypothetical protein